MLQIGLMKLTFLFLMFLAFEFISFIAQKNPKALFNTQCFRTIGYQLVPLSGARFIKRSYVQTKSWLTVIISAISHLKKFFDTFSYIFLHFPTFLMRKTSLQTPPYKMTISKIEYQNDYVKGA